ncbi:MAG: ABC transporter ATP-binding protein [Atopobiaceae bacterium]|nr:ABC transporter ATP-binding protein [Atopobiaceae bacterium]
MANLYSAAAGGAGTLAVIRGDDSGPSRNDGDKSSVDAASYSSGYVVRRIARAALKHGGLVALAFISSVVSGILQLYVPILIGRGIDCIVGAGQVDFAGIDRVVRLALFVVIIAAASSWVASAAASRLAATLAADLRSALSKQLHEIPLSYHDAHNRGDLLSRCINDVEAVADGLLQTITQFFGGIVSIVATIAFMLSLSPVVTLVVVVLTPLSIGVAALIARFSASSFDSQQALQGTLSSSVEEGISNHRLIRAFAKQDEFLEDFSLINQELQLVGERAQFISSLTNPSTRLVNNIIYALVALVGCVCLGTGWPSVLSVGQVSSFLSYAHQYMKPFNEISAVVTQLQTAISSAARIFAVLDEPLPAKPSEPLRAKPSEPLVGKASEPLRAKPSGSNQKTPNKTSTSTDASNTAAKQEAPNKMSLSTDSDSVVANAPARVPSAQLKLPRPVSGALEFSDVHFSYIDGVEILKGISFTASPGQRIALVGPTGCGKTTLVSLLMRFYDVDSGVIKLDGIDINKLDKDDLRAAFGMVLQDSWIFEGTIHDNIAYGKPNASHDELVAAAKRAHAHGFIEQLPLGYDTVIASDGVGLSAGQRQLICIARVMLADPPVLLLDEATSSIDARTERLVQEAFDEMMHNRTSLVVAHRLSTIKDADCILLMDGGRIIERGSYSELLAYGGRFAALHAAQFPSTL